MEHKEKLLVVVVGPTAVGKTALCIELAKLFNTEIVSADSRQFYRELNIGTAKPLPEELATVKHHFINSLSIKDDYNIVKYEKQALEKIIELFLNRQVVILTGGSGLYVKAVCEGIDEIPKVDLKVRNKLNQIKEEKGLKILIDQLKEVDPEYYEQVDTSNTHRVIRALEVCLGTGRPFSKYLKNKKEERPFAILKVGLELDRDQLYHRINKRMEMMIKNGLFDEAESLFKDRSLNALQTVGYQEIFGYLSGEFDKTEAIRLLKRNSRRYAKRQLTWFRRDEEIRWFDPKDLDKITKLIHEKVIEHKADR